MTRPELWALIDGIASVHPPGGHHRVTNAELVEWLLFVSTSLLATANTRRQAKKAAGLVPKIIGPVYELPFPRRMTEVPTAQDQPKRSHQPSLFDGVV